MVFVTLWKFRIYADESWLFRKGFFQIYIASFKLIPKKKKKILSALDFYAIKGLYYQSLIE